MKTEAQRRTDDIAAFGRELVRLEGEQVLALDAAQRERVATHHRRLLDRMAHEFRVDRTAHEEKLSLGMRIASFLGALALSASVFYLFRQFWGDFDTPAQVITLIGAALATLAGTFAVRARDASGYFTKLMAMVAFVCFALNIYLLGQLFNIAPSDKAFIVWAAYALLLAYACEQRLLLGVGLLCFTAFLSARTGTVSGLYWLDFGERPENFLPAGALLLALPGVIPQARYPGFAPVYRVFGLLAVFLPVLVLANWGEASYFDAGWIEGFYQLFGFAGSAAAIWLGLRHAWPETVNTGMVFFVIFLYTKFFDWWWESMPKYLFFLVLGLMAILLLLVLRRLRAALVHPVTDGTHP